MAKDIPWLARDGLNVRPASSSNQGQSLADKGGLRACAIDADPLEGRAMHARAA